MMAITFFSAAITLFSAVTFFAWRNGRIIKETSLHTQELIKETSIRTETLIKETSQQTQQLINQTQQLIREEGKENRLLLEKISQLIAHIPAKTKELMKE
jgi:hypothetical protein